MDWIHSIYVYFRVGHSTGKPADSPVCRYVDLSETDQKKADDGSGTGGRVITLEELSKLPREGRVRICCISDTHERHSVLTIPPCDILVHCGDILFASRFKSAATSKTLLAEFAEWLSHVPATFKLVVAGNHDLGLEQLSALDDASTGASVPTNDSVEYHNGCAQVKANGAGDTPYKGRAAVLGENVIYLYNQYVMLEGLGFFGSPYSHGHSGNQAFQQESCLTEALQRLQLLREQGRPVDVLLAHSNALERPFSRCYLFGDIFTTCTGLVSAPRDHPRPRQLRLRLHLQMQRMLDRCRCVRRL